MAEYEVHGGYLVVGVDQCTCSGGNAESGGRHEDGCGWEMIGEVERILHDADERRRHWGTTVVTRGGDPIDFEFSKDGGDARALAATQNSRLDEMKIDRLRWHPAYIVIADEPRAE